MFCDRVLELPRKNRNVKVNLEIILDSDSEITEQLKLGYFIQYDELMIIVEHIKRNKCTNYTKCFMRLCSHCRRFE